MQSIMQQLHPHHQRHHYLCEDCRVSLHYIFNIFYVPSVRCSGYPFAVKNLPEQNVAKKCNVQSFSSSFRAYVAYFQVQNIYLRTNSISAFQNIQQMSKTSSLSHAVYIINLSVRHYGIRKISTPHFPNVFALHTDQFYRFKWFVWESVLCIVHACHIFTKFCLGNNKNLVKFLCAAMYASAASN